MKYGDIIKEPDWQHRWPAWKRYPRLSYRFRIDPVPCIGRKQGRAYFRLYYKTPRHINEKKQFYACDDSTLVRGRRRPRNLQDPYDDLPRSDIYLDSSWKKNHKVRKQWEKHIVG